MALIGYRGTGKTTVGRLIAARSGRPFADADDVIEARAGSIASIFADQGEAAFRDLEAQVIGDLAESEGLILATGGGAVLREANRLALKQLGRVVWLRAEPGELAARLTDDDRRRPALTSRGTVGEIDEVLRARTPIYRAAADFEIDTTGRTPEQVASLVLERWTEAGR